MEVNTAHLALLAEADVLGRTCPDKAELLERVELFREYCKEQMCYGQPRIFSSDLARFTYFQKEGSAPEYEPYDTTTCEVILLSALPGSGKDYFIHKHYADWPVISLDDIRRKHKIDPTDRKRNGWVVQEAKEHARSLLRQHQSFIWNATNITRSMRQLLIDLFTTYGARVRVVYIEVPYRRLVEQNNKREFGIPPTVLERLIEKLEVPSPTEAWQVEVIGYG